MILEQKNIPVKEEFDVVVARRTGRELARQLGFNLIDQTRITTSISELARNIVLYAGTGEVIISLISEGESRGMEILARDWGPGIPDPDEAMQEGFSTSNGLGAGLPGVRRLMDEFHLESEPGRGTWVQVKKWLKGDSWEKL